MNRDYTIRKKGYDPGIPIKTVVDIVNDLGFQTEEEKYICEDIIRCLEETAKNEILAEKVVAIPTLGTMWITKLRGLVKENIEKVKELRKENKISELKTFLGEICSVEKGKSLQGMRIESVRTAIKRANHKIYDKIYMKQGSVAASKFIDMIMGFVPVEFNQELEDMMREIYEN